MRLGYLQYLRRTSMMYVSAKLGGPVVKYARRISTWCVLAISSTGDAAAPRASRVYAVSTDISLNRSTRIVSRTPRPLCFSLLIPPPSTRSFAAEVLSPSIPISLSLIYFHRSTTFTPSPPQICPILCANLRWASEIHSSWRSAERHGGAAEHGGGADAGAEEELARRPRGLVLG